MLELFSYRTRSGWLPRLSPLPCSGRCKCNLLHPLSWHLLLSILNHPRSGCTYHPFQGQCCYCSRGKKEGKTVQGGAHHKCLLTQLEGPTNNCFNSLTMICSRLFLGKAAAGTQQRQEDQKKSCPVLNVSDSIHNMSTAFVCISSSLALTSVF